MVRTQIYLTEIERKELADISSATGKKQSELIREAVDIFIERCKSKNRKAILDRISGMWRDHDQLPDFDRLRTEWDRKS